jgi:hypothetical protein
LPTPAICQRSTFRSSSTDRPWVSARISRRRVVNTLRLLGRWMRMFTIANQSSVAKAYKEFVDDDRMPSCWSTAIPNAAKQV